VALSDGVFLTIAVMAYLVAMLLHAADFAFGRQSHVARAATRELVGAGVGAGLDGSAPSTGSLAVDGGDAALDAGEDSRGGTGWGAGLVSGGFGVTAGEGKAEKGQWLLTAALGVTWIAALAHAATVVTRSLDAGRMPWGNMYEYVMTGTLLASAIWLTIAALRPAVRHLGLFVVLMQVLLTGVAGIVLRKPLAPLAPALDSFWFVVHVGSVITATGLFLVGFAASVMFLIRSGYDEGKRTWLYPYGRLLTNAATAERLSFRLHAFAFPIWTFGVTAGAIWAEAAWGRYWGWDPKEVWAFISWVVYAGYLHARATPSVSKRTAAWIAVVGWLTMMMNLFGVNIFLSGLHSYGGV
jgi:cytochrome c-type biogenesis protein CcsB